MIASSPPPKGIWTNDVIGASTQVVGMEAEKLGHVLKCA